MELVKYKDGEYAKDGLHLPATSIQDAETLCGIFSPGYEPTFVEGDAPECPECIRAAKELFSRYTKKQVNSWIGKN